MSEVHTISLDWKEHKIDLRAFEAWARSESASCIGLSADSSLRLHFSEAPSQELSDAVQAKWAELDDAEAAMCESYQSREDLQAVKDQARESAKAKLAALGLSEAEVAALVG